MWGLSKLKAKNDNKEEVSFIDVKELYDAAFAEKAKAKVNFKKFNKLIEKATLLDEAYRAQLRSFQSTRYEVAA